MKHFFLLSLSLFALQGFLQGQTVGTLLNTEEAMDGYTLLDPMGTGNTHLINNCGEVINTWTSDFNSGGACYLLEDGSLARARSTAHLRVAASAVAWNGKTGRTN